MENICPVCGKSNPLAARECESCGAVLSSENQTAPRKINWAMAVGCGCLIFIILGVVAPLSCVSLLNSAAVSPTPLAVTVPTAVPAPAVPDPS